MTNLFSSKKILALAACCMLSAGALWADINPKPFVVPELKTWSGAEGQTALSGRIVVKNAKLKAVAAALAADYKEMFGKELTIVNGATKGGDVVLSLKKNKALGDEGYTMNVGSAVEITAATERGAFWATRTLLQIAEQHKDGNLPKGKTTDVPEYKLRGFMIDCGRKFIPMSYLRDLAKIMAYYKMNTLQVHLNDNGFRQYFGGDWNKTQAAFRLECDTYPGLTAKDGSYSKQEFIDFQKLAEQNGVEVIPEIDAPAHSLAFTQYKNEIGSKEYGMDHLDLFNPETYKFMDGLWKEYIGGKNPVFIGKRVHIGTDEYSNAKKDVVEKFREFTDHYIKYVESFGKQAVVWGALTHANGDTKVKNKGVLMDIWYNGYADPVEMKKQGYKLVSIPDGLVYIVPAAGYYYDYLNCQYLYEHWTPAVIGNKTFEENDPMIEGGMFAVWNDHAGNGISTKDVHHRVYPALQTLAVKCWTGKDTKLPYAEFDSKRAELSEAPGVNELGRLGKPGSVVLEKATVNAGETLNAEEIGYNYAVTFTVDGKQEANGTELFRSANAVVYLADPEQGKLGFERDGYRNLFNYRIPAGEKHTITIEGTNKMTRLLVDGAVKEELGPKTLYVMRDQDRAHYQVKGTYTYEPVVYQPTDQIYYQRTLVFPLRKAGNFKSTITNLKVEAK
ncbi:glycosyl hydrolase family 20 [Prevotella sp. CAG:5226]|uniref:family 20 glycosylhydrolase n=1 Tax=uncultured Prevotellamassilia sp. TaxID=1926676 RepID=UPI0003384ED3|nr:family 20 glycosylhydrolase [uncultured Prevotellamassilia sp.]CDA44787.1 glycosyl hydrolase family 20 [Prevotella sp. CAG:5226]